MLLSSVVPGILSNVLDVYLVRLDFRALGRWCHDLTRAGCMDSLVMARLSRAETPRLPHIVRALKARGQRVTRWRSAPRYWTDNLSSIPLGSYYSVRPLLKINMKMKNDQK